MKLIQIYECLCDETRLRILNLLSRQPLCVWQLQEVLRVPQVRVSKHLSYLRDRQMVESFRQANEIVYHLPRKPSRELVSHLKCLQDCGQENSSLRADLTRLAALKYEAVSVEPG